MDSSYKEMRKLVINESEARNCSTHVCRIRRWKIAFRHQPGIDRDHISPRAKRSQGWWQTAVRQVFVESCYKGSEVVNRHCPYFSDKLYGFNQRNYDERACPCERTSMEIAQDRMQTNKHVKPNKTRNTLTQAWLPVRTADILRFPSGIITLAGEE